MDIPQDKIEQAKNIILEACRNKARVWYSDLYSAINLDYTNPGDRQLGSHILGAISRESNDLRGVMLSAVVNSKRDGGPAEGFYELAIELGRLPLDTPASERFHFWAKEFKRCHELYADS